MVIAPGQQLVGPRHTWVIGPANPALQPARAGATAMKAAASGVYQLLEEIHCAIGISGLCVQPGQQHC